MKASIVKVMLICKYKTLRITIYSSSKPIIPQVNRQQIRKEEVSCNADTMKCYYTCSKLMTYLVVE